MMNEENILDFWRWFVKNESRIQQCILNNDAKEQEKIVYSLNEYVLGFGAFSWDIGQNDEDQWFFTISPNLNIELLETSKSVIELAPDHLNWHFHSSKPTKTWSYQLEVYDELLDVFQVDTSRWYYNAFEEEDGSIELVFEIGSLAKKHTEAIENAITAFIINELGEEILMQEVSKINFFDEFDADLSRIKSPVSELKAHLLSK
jgi:hypothetical protein